MELTKETLKRNFDEAKRLGMPYVFIALRAEGVDEVIVVPERSFDSKEEFYMNAYSDDLTHVMNKNVYIRGLSFGRENELPRII